MRRKPIIKIIAVSVMLTVLLMLIPTTRDIVVSAFQATILFFQTSSIFILAVLILAVVFLIIIIIYGKRIEWFGIKKALGTGKEKIYSIMECEDAARHYISDEFGIEDYSVAVGNGSLSVKGRFINPPTSDTPYCIFLLSLKQASLDKKDKTHELGEHMAHFTFVCRRTLDVSYNPDIDEWDGAFDWLDKLRMQALPIEMTKKPLERAMEEEMKRGFLRREGEKLAGPSPEEKQESENK